MFTPISALNPPRCFTGQTSGHPSGHLSENLGRGSVESMLSAGSRDVRDPGPGARRAGGFFDGRISENMSWMIWGTPIFGNPVCIYIYIICFYILYIWIER